MEFDSFGTHTRQMHVECLIVDRRNSVRQISVLNLTHQLKASTTKKIKIDRKILFLQLAHPNLLVLLPINNQPVTKLSDIEDNWVIALCEDEFTSEGTPLYELSERITNFKKAPLI